MLIDNQYDDEQLLLHLSHGDEASFEAIYRKYSSGLYLKLLSMLKSDIFADDILQETFLVVWDNREKIDSCRSFWSYISCIAANKCYDHFRQIARTKKLFFNLAKSHDELPDNNQILINKEQSAILFQTINLLPPKRKIIFRMCKIDGKSYEEVSQQLGISLSTISDHIVKANIFIRSRLFPLTT